MSRSITMAQTTGGAGIIAGIRGGAIPVIMAIPIIGLDFPFMVAGDISVTTGAIPHTINTATGTDIIGISHGDTGTMAWECTADVLSIGATWSVAT